jgi:hypothetical protein
MNINEQLMNQLLSRTVQNPGGGQFNIQNGEATYADSPESSAYANVIGMGQRPTGAARVQAAPNTLTNADTAGWLAEMYAQQSQQQQPRMATPTAAPPTAMEQPNQLPQPTLNESGFNPRSNYSFERIPEMSEDYQSYVPPTAAAEVPAQEQMSYGSAIPFHPEVVQNLKDTGMFEEVWGNPDGGYIAYDGQDLIPIQEHELKHYLRPWGGAINPPNMDEITRVHRRPEGQVTWEVPTASGRSLVISNDATMVTPRLQDLRFK